MLKLQQFITVRRAMEIGKFDGISAKTLASYLTSLISSPADYKKLRQAIDLMQVQQNKERQKSRLKELQAKFTQKFVAKELEKSMQTHSWYWKGDAFSEKEHALYQALDDWFGKDTSDKFETAVCYYSGDGDTYRKMSTREANKCYTDAEKFLIKLAKELKLLTK